MRNEKKKHVVIRNLLIDICCAGIALTVFALFHHETRFFELGKVVGHRCRRHVEAGGDIARSHSAAFQHIQTKRFLSI